MIMKTGAADVGEKPDRITVKRSAIENEIIRPYTRYSVERQQRDSIGAGEMLATRRIPRGTKRSMRPKAYTAPFRIHKDNAVVFWNSHIGILRDRAPMAPKTATRMITHR
jgi:hypothetical protein